MNNSNHNYNVTSTTVCKDADLMRQGKISSERDDKAKSMPYNFSPAKYAFFYCDTPQPPLDDFNRLKYDRANFTRTDVLLSPKYKGKINLFASNLDEYETHLAKIDSVPIKSDESLNDEPRNQSLKTMSSADAMKFYEASSDESNQSIFTLVSPSRLVPRIKMTRNSVLSISSDSKIELSRGSKEINNKNVSRSYQDISRQGAKEFEEDIRFNTVPLNKPIVPKIKAATLLNNINLCNNKNAKSEVTEVLSLKAKIPNNHKHLNSHNPPNNNNINDNSFDDYNDTDEKELSNFVNEINEQNMGEVTNSVSDDSDSDDDIINTHFKMDFPHKPSPPPSPNSKTADRNKKSQCEGGYVNVVVNENIIDNSGNFHHIIPLFKNHHLTNHHHFHSPNHQTCDSNHSNDAESQPTEPLASDTLLEQLKISLTQRCIKETDRPSAARLAKRLFFLQGFKKSDVSRHLSKRNSFAQLVGEEYLKNFDFTDQALLQSLRHYLSTSIPTNSEVMCDKDQVLLHFSRRYIQCNPQSELKDEGTCHALSYCIVMLDHDIHYQTTIHKPTMQDFFNNLLNKSPQHNLPVDFLQDIFSNILLLPLEGATDEINETYKKCSAPRSSSSSTTTTSPSFSSSTSFTDGASNTLTLTSSFKGVNQFLLVYNDYLHPTERPPEYKKGYIMEKCCLDSQGKKTGLGRRGWKMFYCILCNQTLLFFHSEKASKNVAQSQKSKGIKAKIAGIISSKSIDGDDGSNGDGAKGNFSPYSSTSTSSLPRGFNLSGKKSTVKNLIGFTNSDDVADEDDDCIKTDGGEYNILDDNKSNSSSSIHDTTNHQANHHSHPLVLSLAEKATDYSKRSHVFRLYTSDLSQYLIQTSDMKECQDWVDMLNTLAALHSTNQALKQYNNILSSHASRQSNKSKSNARKYNKLSNNSMGKSNGVDGKETSVKGVDNEINLLDGLNKASGTCDITLYGDMNKTLSSKVNRSGDENSRLNVNTHLNSTSTTTFENESIKIISVLPTDLPSTTTSTISTTTNASVTNTHINNMANSTTSNTNTTSINSGLSKTTHKNDNTQAHSQNLVISVSKNEDGKGVGSDEYSLGSDDSNVVGSSLVGSGGCVSNEVGGVGGEGGGVRRRYEKTCPRIDKMNHSLPLRELIDRYDYLTSAFEQVLLAHRRDAPEKGSKSKTIQNYCATEALYLFYIKRFKTYSKTLHSHWLTLNQLEPSLVETIIGEVEEPSASPRHHCGRSGEVVRGEISMEGNACVIPRKDNPSKTPNETPNNDINNTTISNDFKNSEAVIIISTNSDTTFLSNSAFIATSSPLDFKTTSTTVSNATTVSAFVNDRDAMTQCPLNDNQIGTSDVNNYTINDDITTANKTTINNNTEGFLAYSTNTTTTTTTLEITSTRNTTSMSEARLDVDYTDAVSINDTASLVASIITATTTSAACITSHAVSITTATTTFAASTTTTAATKTMTTTLSTTYIPIEIANKILPTSEITNDESFCKENQDDKQSII